MKLSMTVPAGKRGAFTIGHRQQHATLADLPAEIHKLLTTPVTATLACLNADGSIHQSPVWVDTDGDQILLNTVRGRIKDRNLRARQTLSLLLTDPTDPYRWVSFQCRVDRVIDEDDPQHGRAATESINRMSAKYLGHEVYPLRDSHTPEVRALFRATPTHAVVYDPTPHSKKRRLMTAYAGARAVVVGGSIGGLTTALLLRDLGFTVDVYERSAEPLSGRGSGIVLQPDTYRWFSERSDQSLESLQTSTRYVQYLRGSNTPEHREDRVHHFTAWGAFYRALLSDFGLGQYHLGKHAGGFSQSGGSVTVEFLDGNFVSADLAVFADGISSVARRKFDPDSAMHYSGYVGWRGTHPQHKLTRSARTVLSDAITFDLMPSSHLVVYPIPGDQGTRAQDRLMNYVWYRNVNEGSELEDLLLDARGNQGAVSVPPGLVRKKHLAQLKNVAHQQLSPAIAELVGATEQPYVQAVLDVRSTRMATGCVALIGDGACAARPHAAAGTAKAAADAWALATALGESNGDIAGALAKWEPPQLALSDLLIRRVIAMGEKFQVTNAAVPGDPSLRFGLYGPGR